MSEWISTKERNPNFGETVLVAFDTNVGTKQYTTANYVNLKICAHSDTRVPMWFVTVSSGHKLSTITHWMPLPEPPKDDQ